MRLTAPLLSLLSLQHWAAANRGIHCGTFQAPSSLEVLESIQVKDHSSFKAQYIDTIHLQAVFSVLPVHLLVAIDKDWSLNSYDLAELLAQEQRHTSDTWHLRQAIEFYRKASRQRRNVCWISDVRGYVGIHKNVLGAINNLLLSPMSAAGYNMPRRLGGLPSGLLREDKPICFSSKDNVQAEWFKSHLPALHVKRPNFQEDATTNYLDFSKMLNETDTWAGTLGRVVYRTIIKAKSGRALGKVRPGVPIPAATYGSVFDLMSNLFGKEANVCFTIGKMRNGAVPPEYYWIDVGNNPPYRTVRT
ncbi:hypothetical protein GQ602_003741 [Ophiocordyceps camponoti-floridani]|uniref:Uncharacterized protein n=1 Tax=Ophiocordyceps camponoti-floridani TaxID=2030778 RepID=A0A8H4Q8R8_9HYPO|nr:hypothetical protein GQ602_003741 [Ophiocordyceps camponoti-floridani]